MLNDKEFEALVAASGRDHLPAVDRPRFEQWSQRPDLAGHDRDMLGLVLGLPATPKPPAVRSMDAARQRARQRMAQLGFTPKATA